MQALFAVPSGLDGDSVETIVNYPERGCDYHGYPAHDPPGYLNLRAMGIFLVIEKELAQQGFESKNGAYICFRKDDNRTRLEGDFSVAKIAEKIDEYLTEEEKK